tara:strand:- start:260 stop:409 length:150 start_codon:yes stop_codon:yes gene_type:complete
MRVVNLIGLIYSFNEGSLNEEANKRPKTMIRRNDGILNLVEAGLGNPVE